jgi:nicotinamide riboside kinase
MKVAFAGSHSTGKTTLLDEIVRVATLQKVIAIREIARVVIERGFPLEKNSTTDSFVNYIKDQLRAERDAEKLTFDLLVSDRTVLDAYGYAIVNHTLPRPHVPDYFIEMLQEVAIREAQFYDLFVFFPVEFDMTPDPVRPNDLAYREAVGSALKDALQQFGIRHVNVKGNIEQRLQILRTVGVLM